MLHNALGAEGPRHLPASYGPSTLYREVRTEAARRGVRMGLFEGTPTAPDDVVGAIDVLLRRPEAEVNVAELGEELIAGAVRQLTLRTVHSILAGTDVEQRLAQKQLATALLRWSILR